MQNGHRLLAVTYDAWRGHGKQRTVLSTEGRAQSLCLLRGDRVPPGRVVTTITVMILKHCCKLSSCSACLQAICICTAHITLW